MPYFEGDFWPNALEDSIKELDQEEEERKTAAAAAAAETASKEVPNDIAVTLSKYISNPARI